MRGLRIGRQVTLCAMVISPDIKAGVIGDAVVASYPDIIDHWNFVGVDREQANAVFLIY